MLMISKLLQILQICYKSYSNIKNAFCQLFYFLPQIGRNVLGGDEEGRLSNTRRGRPPVKSGWAIFQRGQRIGLAMQDCVSPV